jgi:hypothetical protein
MSRIWNYEDIFLRILMLKGKFKLRIIIRRRERKKICRKLIGFIKWFKILIFWNKINRKVYSISISKLWIVERIWW